jgi:autotransporter translocation and assembly factor TamB
VSVSNVNLAQLASRLRSTQIGGKVQIQTKADQAIYFQTQLSDARAKLNVEAKYSVHPTTHEQVLSLDTVALQAGGSQVNGAGRVQFGGAAAFQFQGQVRRFDPAFWWAMPNAQMDADFLIKGSYSPKLNWALDLSRFDANFRGQNMTGLAQVSLRSDASFEVQKLEMLWGKNSLNGSGIWGLDNEQLYLSLDAPYLNNFSVLLNRSMQGSAKVQAQLSGTLSEPAGSIKIEAQNIGLAQKFSLANLQAQFDMGKGAQGVLNLNAQAQQLRLSSPSKNTTPVTQSQAENLIHVVDDISLKFNGQKDQHKIDAKIGFADRSRITMTAQGALSFAGQFDPNWIGKVDSLKLHGNQEIQLSEAWPMNFHRNKFPWVALCCRGV